MGARTTNMGQHYSDVIQGPGPPDAKADCEAKAGKLFEKLDLRGLESWPPKLADSTQSLLAEYHDIFSLEPSKLGYTHSTEHVIKVTDDVPFKE